MRDNVTLPLGSIAVTDKIESDYGLISGIFGKAGGSNTYTLRNPQNDLANSYTSISQGNSVGISCTKKNRSSEKDGKRQRTYQKGEKAQCSPDVSFERRLDRPLSRNSALSCRHTQPWPDTNRVVENAISWRDFLLRALSSLATLNVISSFFNSWLFAFPLFFVVII